MEDINSWLGHWEPIWLFVLIAAEALYSYLGHSMTNSFYKFLKEQKRVQSRKKKVELPEEGLTSGESK